MVSVFVSGNSIDIGRQLENDAREIYFDLSELEETYGQGTATLVHMRQPDSAPYVCDTRVYGQYLIWTVNNTDTAYAGTGKCELRWVVGETLAKSITYITFVAPSITAGEVVPDPYQAWYESLLEQITEYVIASDQIATNAENIAENTDDLTILTGRVDEMSARYVTPEMYGAKGDGVTDDTEAIQNAINSGQNVVFANKVYLCGTVTISGNNQVISGNYATLTHGTNSGFILAKTAHDIIIRNFNSICTYVKDSQNATNVHIGINADADSPNAEYYVYNITITGCTFNGGVMGISASSAKGINVNNCKFNSFVYKPEDLSGGYGILLQSCVDCKISFCDFNVGEYGRHDIYVSIDQRKSINKKCKNIYIDSCIFSHQDLVEDSSGFYYSPNTVSINVRSSMQVNVQNCYFYAVTGAVSFISDDGEIDSANILNCVVDAPILNSGLAETRSIINVTSVTNQTSFLASGIDVINEPNDYNQFMSLQNCVAKIANCNIGATRFIFGQDVTAQINNITTKITYYLIRFNGGDETKGNCKNVTFLNALVGEKYYFATGSAVPSDFFGEPVEEITLNVEGTNINSLTNNSYRQGKVAVLSGYFKPNANGDPSNTILARMSGVETIVPFKGLAWMGSTTYPLLVDGTRIIVSGVNIPATSNYIHFQCSCILK